MTKGKKGIQGKETAGCVPLEAAIDENPIRHGSLYFACSLQDNRISTRANELLIRGYTGALYAADRRSRAGRLPGLRFCAGDQSPVQSLPGQGRRAAPVS